MCSHLRFPRLQAVAISQVDFFPFVLSLQREFFRTRNLPATLNDQGSQIDRAGSQAENDGRRGDFEKPVEDRVPFACHQSQADVDLSRHSLDLLEGGSRLGCHRCKQFSPLLRSDFLRGLPLLGFDGAFLCLLNHQRSLLFGRQDARLLAAHAAPPRVASRIVDENQKYPNGQPPPTAEDGQQKVQDVIERFDLAAVKRRLSAAVAAPLCLFDVCHAGSPRTRIPGPGRGGRLFHAKYLPAPMPSHGPILAGTQKPYKYPFALCIAPPRETRAPHQPLNPSASTPQPATPPERAETCLWINTPKTGGGVPV